MVRRASLGEVGREGFEMLGEMNKAFKPYNYNPYHYTQQYQQYQQPRQDDFRRQHHQYQQACRQAVPRKGAMDCNEVAQRYGGVVVMGRAQRQVVDCDEAVRIYGGVLVKEKLIPTKMYF
ncbi:hypothetical protein Sjap_007424 [Stephania japonica]|uniref:Uncharacterized protein n=1 Tax=Stephania japonica TaxID=461633 RepID=A0AAP0JPT7_9MAGN